MDETLVNRFLYYPERLPPEMPPPPWATDASEVWIETEDGVKLHGLWYDEPRDRPVILFLHGNAQEVYSWSLVREDLEVAGCRMLLVDYRGYGKSGGRPSEQGLYSDGRAALDWVLSRGIDAGSVVVFGKSLGGAVACEISRGLPLMSLVLESTFTSLASVASRLFPYAADIDIDPGMYDSLSRLPSITCPVMVIHGDADMLIPVEEGLRLFEGAGEPKELMVIEGAGHNDVSMVGGIDYRNGIRDWLDSLA